MFQSADRRARMGRKPAEGITPYVLAALGGMALMLLWLKIGSLAGVRRVAGADFHWAFFLVAGAAGALLGVAAQLAWGQVGSLAFRTLKRPASPRDLRLVWGASAFPQVAVLVALLPLDLIIVGTNTFTSERLADSLATGWAALSIAFSVSLAVWSVFLFVRGIDVATEAGPLLSLLAVIVAGACLVGIVTALGAGAVALSEAG